MKQSAPDSYPSRLRFSTKNTFSVRICVRAEREVSLAACDVGDPATSWAVAAVGGHWHPFFCVCGALCAFGSS
jgi:hypothetical protein